MRNGQYKMIKVESWLVNPVKVFFVNYLEEHCWNPYGVRRGLDGPYFVV